MQLSDDIEVCRDYMRGVCQRGEYCSFFHPKEVLVPPNHLNFCRDYQRGQCFRPHCKYVHATLQQKVFYQWPSGYCYVSWVLVPHSGGLPLRQQMHLHHQHRKKPPEPGGGMRGPNEGMNE